MSSPPETETSTNAPPTPPDGPSKPLTALEQLQKRPPQKSLEMMYNDAIRTLARCDQDYCEDPDEKWALAGLQYVLTYQPESWEPLMQLMDSADGVEQYMNTQFTNIDIPSKIQADLNAYRFSEWKNPLYNYDARLHRSPLWYRGAADMWRRNKHQQQGRPGTLQCLDFASPYHQLKKQYQRNPDNHKLERKFAYATWDQYACVAGLQCPSLQPYALWCGHNPAATPDQVKQCLQILPRYAECSKPGFTHHVVEQPPENVFTTVDENGNPLPEADLKRKHIKKVRAALRFRNWVIQAELVTNQRRLMLDPHLSERLSPDSHDWTIFGPASIPIEQQAELYGQEQQRRVSQLRKDIADETGDLLEGVVPDTEEDFVFAGNSEAALNNKEKLAGRSPQSDVISTLSEYGREFAEDSRPLKQTPRIYGLESGELGSGFGNDYDDIRDADLRSSRQSRFAKTSYQNNSPDRETPSMVSKYSTARRPAPQRDASTPPHRDQYTTNADLDDDFPELFEPIQTSLTRENPQNARRVAPKPPQRHEDNNNVNQVGRVGKVAPGTQLRKLAPEPAYEDVIRHHGSSQEFLNSLLQDNDHNNNDDIEL